MLITAHIPNSNNNKLKVFEITEDQQKYFFNRNAYENYLQKTEVRKTWHKLQH
jgi:hypothetical protein